MRLPGTFLAKKDPDMVPYDPSDFMVRPVSLGFWAVSVDVWWVWCLRSPRRVSVVTSGEQVMVVASYPPRV